MSRMIQCDSCKSLVNDDCSAKAAGYRELWINHEQAFHLCRQCYDSMMRNIFHMRYDADEQQYVEDE